MEEEQQQNLENLVTRCKLGQMVSSGGQLVFILHFGQKRRK
jgi:hypothetical protein